jgi:hypothetical protein
LPEKIERFFKDEKIGALLKAAGAYKSKGFSVVSVLKYLFCLCFEHRTMYMDILTRGMAEFAKDTAYRLLNAPQINWMRFTTMLCARIVKDGINDSTDEKRANVLIVDDTLRERNRSKKVELLAKVYDHAKGVYKKGFRLLTLGWSDGNTFLPVNSCLMSTENKKNRVIEAKAHDKRSLAYKKRTMAQNKMSDVVMDLLRAAKAAKIPASYVLFDTWFAYPASFMAIKDMGYDVIAMVKKAATIKYLHNGKMQSVLDIYRQNKKRRGRSKYLMSVIVSIVKDGKAIPAKIVYVRNRNKRSEYLCLVSTDTSISEEEIIRIYGKRWNIEVFFKVCKSYLRLNGEIKSLSYDAVTAHAAIVFTRYMMIALEARQSTDYRTYGGIFLFLCDEVADITVVEAMNLLLQMLTDALSEKTFLTDAEIKWMLRKFIEAIPVALSSRLRMCA